uniref:DUF4220 domain-containing protein n=1 Tax=Hordeum vulgare subsp. vulgare TaxID=112509 RepID=A0A8I6YG41_HORVV
MRPMKMRNGDKVGSHDDPQSLADVQKLWNQWEIHCLILASFALQVFLFSAAGVRLRSSSRVVGVLLWLGYMSADSVAVFVLGHLSVHTAAGHQLLLFSAPFVLLHLGGQDTITAFSMQDNVLWMRHLLGFASQLAVAIFVVSKSPWPDRRLLASVLLMFLSGCIKYCERIYCLATANPDRLMKEFLRGFNDRVRSIKEMQTIAREGLGSYLSSRTFTELSLNPAMDIMSTDILPNYDWSVSRDVFKDLYPKQIDPSTPHYRRHAYAFAEDRLWVCYQRLYTKAMFRLSPAGALLHLIGFLSTSLAMALFFMAGKSGELRRYSGPDVAVSIVLLVGAVTLEAASLVMSMFSREDLWRHPLCWSGNLHVIRCVFFVTCGPCADWLRRRWRKPQWSKTLTQYSIITGSVKRASGSSMVPRWIVERLSPGASGIEYIPVTDDLKHLVIKNLLDDKMMSTDFTSSRGEATLGRWWPDQQAPQSLSLSEKVLSESVKEVDFPTSVLIWHIATDIRFFTDAAGDASPADNTIICRQLSGYIMYLIFKCGVMLSSNSKFLLRKARDEIISLVKHGRQDDQGQHDGSRRKKGTAMAVQHLVSSQMFAQARSANAVPINPSTADILGDPVLPRAFRVAEALAGVSEADRWELIVHVWLEMFYYIAPRCGAAFHREHLSTGGEFITHVLVLMYSIGPLGYHPSLLQFGPH